MDELLQQLLEAEVLNQETKTELEKAFKSQLEEAITGAKEEAAADVRAELTESWIAERDKLIEAIDKQVSELLENELDELKKDIEGFRDLEAEHAEKLVEAKAQMSDELKNDLKDLVESIDKFLDMRLAAEMEELKEDIQEVRKNELGRKIYEAFASEFEANYADEKSASVSLRETEKRLSEMAEELAESQNKLASLERERKMAEVLQPLDGRPKEVMEAILGSIETDRLEEAYKVFIGRVLRESEESSEKEKDESDELLAEGTSEDGKKDESLKEGEVKTGDADEVITEDNKSTTSDVKTIDIAKWKKLAGM